MKKTVVRRVVRAAEPIIGNTAGAGVDVSNLYIDMLCERFKDRGIKTSVQSEAEEYSGRDSARQGGGRKGCRGDKRG